MLAYNRGFYLIMNKVVEKANMFACRVLNILYLCRQPPRQSLDGYKHVVDVKFCPPVPSDGPQFPPEAVKAKETAQHSQNNVEFHEIMEGDTITKTNRRYSNLHFD
jgi:hypothetical protein